MNKQDLITNLSSAIDGNKVSPTEAVDLTFGLIAAALARGEDVRITGFGVFKRVETKARTGRNPATGEAMAIAAGYRAKFRPSSKLLVA